MHVLERRTLSVYCCHHLQIKCTNATSYDLHVNVFNVLTIKCDDYFFIKSTFFSPLIHTLSAILLHQPNKYRAIFSASDWLIVHSKKEWNLGHSTREWDSLGIASDQLNVFSALFELKPTRLELNKSRSEIRLNFHSFAFREYILHLKHYSTVCIFLY